jgi:hypothetical protein
MAKDLMFLTKADLSKLPPLGSTDGKGEDAIAVVKFFTPTSNWSWFMTEYDPATETGFGLVFGAEVELGYFDLAEMRAVKGRVWVEKDRYFTPTTLKDIRAKAGNL